MRILNLLFALCFVASALLQYNDPDPVQWMGIYGVAAGVCVAWWRGTPRILPLSLSLAALVWAGVIARGVKLDVPVGQALFDWGMKSGGSEELRETGGLLIVAVWMAIITVVRPAKG